MYALEKIGLTGNEIKVYLALLELGSVSAGEIIKKSGLHRTCVYDTLERLIEKGIVSYVVKANRKYFEATPPERLLDFLDEKVSEIEKEKEEIRKVIPELELKRKLSKEPQEATIFKGKKGLKSVAEDVLRIKKEVFVFGAEGKFVEIFGHYAQQWHKKRRKSGIKLKIIFNEKLRGEKSKEKWFLVEMKFIFKEYDSPATTWIYGDKVAIIVWSEQPIATLIRSKEVAYSYRNFFNVLWKISKK